MPPAHRHGDGRICDATTKVEGQDSVFVNGRLWAVTGDPNTHEKGELVASPDSSVLIGGIPVVTHSPTGALPDKSCDTLGGAHCAPLTSSGSGDVSAYG